MSWVVMALLAWSAITILQHDKILISYGERIETLQEKAKEIVPRSENERRYANIETNVTKNYEALQSLQQSCYQALSNASAQLEKKQ